jgi:hypothetical protein
MVTALQLPPEVAEFRQEAMVEEHDGTLYIVLHGENDNVRNSVFKRPFDPHSVNGLDDGDPHYV